MATWLWKCEVLPEWHLAIWVWNCSQSDVGQQGPLLTGEQRSWWRNWHLFYFVVRLQIRVHWGRSLVRSCSSLHLLLNEWLTERAHCQQREDCKNWDFSDDFDGNACAYADDNRGHWDVSDLQWTVSFADKALAYRKKAVQTKVPVKS